MTDIVQGSDAWRKIRLGKVTASRVADVLAKTKNGWGTSRTNYLAELVAERLTREAAPSYTNAAMAHGTEQEPHARAAYEFRFDKTVIEVGFVPHPRIEMSGCSPDGLVGDSGLVEIKCPNTATHLDTLLNEKIDGKYITQIQWQLACTDRQWCDFVSFDPRLPEAMSLYVRRVQRDDKMIEETESLVKDFLLELDQKVDALRNKYELPSNMAMAG